jgi:hypothetical protein
VNAAAILHAKVRETFVAGEEAFADNATAQ